MGFGLPTAIGASLAQPEKLVLCISGDGSILMNIQELNTLAEHDLNVKIVVMNNQSLGLVRQQQTLFYNNRYIGIEKNQKVSFSAVARAMGIKDLDLRGCCDPVLELTQALKLAGSCLINFPIDVDAKVFPMVPPGAAKVQILEAERL